MQGSGPLPGDVERDRPVGQPRLLVDQVLDVPRATLDDAQRGQWDGAVDALLNARRAPLYLLVDGDAKVVMVRLGASDGTDTEVAGNVKEGDEAITGARSASASSSGSASAPAARP